MKNEKTKMILKIKVKTNSGKQGIEKIGKEEYAISLKSEPEKNKANIELLKLLKRELKSGEEIKEMKIIKGRTSKNKIVRIDFQEKE